MEQTTIRASLNGMETAAAILETFADQAPSSDRAEVLKIAKSLKCKVDFARAAAEREKA